MPDKQVVILNVPRRNRYMLGNVMIEAEQLGMAEGDYIFIAINRYPTKYPWNYFERKPREDSYRKYKAVIYLIPFRENLYNIPFEEAIMSTVKSYFKNESSFLKMIVRDRSRFLLAAALYLKGLGEAHKKGHNDSKTIFGQLKEKLIEVDSFNISVKIDKIGNAEMIYELWSQIGDTAQSPFRPVLRYHVDNESYESIDNLEIQWRGGSVPLNEPKCGFHNDKCKDEIAIFEIILTAVIVAVVLLILTLLHLLGRYRKSSLLSAMPWLIYWEDIKRDVANINSEVTTQNVKFSYFHPQIMMKYLNANPGISFEYSEGFYKNQKVILWNVDNSSLDSDFKPKLSTIFKLRHRNILKMIGASLLEDRIVMVYEDCKRCYLMNVLSVNPNCHSWVVRLSLIGDLVNGMDFLHRTNIGFHGNLTSTCCYIDPSFVLKISKFGFDIWDVEPVDEREESFEAFYWTAPEKLRGPLQTIKDNKMADVYSFAIVLQEVIQLAKPFCSYAKTHLPKRIIMNVQNIATGLFRPQVTRNECPNEELYKLMTECWNEDPNERPDFTIINKQMVEIFKKENIYESRHGNISCKLQEYTNGLVNVIKSQRIELMEEENKIDKLRFNIIPQSLIEKLRNGESVDPKYYPDGTALFVCIDNLQEILRYMNPDKAIELLKITTDIFDTAMKNHDVFKRSQDTDNGLFISGVPITNGDLHATEIANVSLYIMERVLQLKIPGKQLDQLTVRMGIHSGPMSAGIVGKKFPQFRVFGLAIDVAYQMQMSSESLKIQLTRETKKILTKGNKSYITEKRPKKVAIKGIGENCTTYWLKGFNEF